MTGMATIAMDFAFRVNLTAVVRVRAADENAARKVIPTVLGAPGTTEIALANQGNAATGQDATITDVNFCVGSIKAIDSDADLIGPDPTTLRLATRSRRNQLDHRTPTHGYEPTREAAMAAFAKSWRRES
jgi:hypothetical protein